MKFLLRCLLVLCTAVMVHGAYANDTAPDVLVKNITDDVIAIVRQDKSIQSGDVRKAVELVEAKVAPFFNFTHMTALAIGRDWRQATPAQKAQLTQEFKMLLVRTYSSALTQYKNQAIELKPLRMQPTDTDVVVRTEVRRSNGTPIKIDYSLEKLADGWKFYDVMVEGASLVTSYRGSFGDEIRAGGIDGLIKSLQNRNRLPPESSHK